MQALTTNDLSLVNREPRVLDLKLADALEFSEGRMIRKLIDRNMAELQDHGEVCSTVSQTSPHGGRPGQQFWLNEPQALLIAMFSRTEKAATVRSELIRVFMDWRRSQAQAVVLEAPRPELPGEPLRVLELKLASVREARLLFGPARAARLWDELGLPVVPEPADTPDAEARRCLLHLLAEPINDADRRDLREVLSKAIDDDAAALSLLRSMGFRLEFQGNDVAIWIANRSAWLDAAFQSTVWENGDHRHALSRLPGACAGRVNKVGSDAVRGVLVPGAFLDTTRLQ